MKIIDIDSDSLSIIFEFLGFKDAINLCYTNKEHYLRLIIFCYLNSVVSVDLSKKEVFFSKYQRKVLPFNIFASFSTFDRPNRCTIDIYDQIKYVTYLNSVNEIDKLNGLIPKKLKGVQFGRKFNIPWNKKFLPDSVKSIYFHNKCKFNYNISSINLPSNLTRITFGYMFDKSIDDLPDTVEVITFCKNSRFNKYIGKWPRNLKEIYIGTNFNHPLMLPEGVTTVYFSHSSIFDNYVEWPDSIEKISFGKKFNQSINHLLTKPNIKSIKFHTLSIFNQPISCGVSPVQSISFGKYFNQPIDVEKINKDSIKFAKRSRFEHDLNN